MTNTDKLRGKMAESHITQEKAAEYLGISRQAYIKKMNNEIPFKISEVTILAERCNMTRKERDAIFFS